MPVQRINPFGLPQPEMYSHVAVATGSRIVFIAGQVPHDVTGELVGEGDLAAQTEQALRNVATALAAAGASFADIGRLTIYVVGYDESTLEHLGAGLARAADAVGGDGPPPPATLVGVAALAVPGQLVEIEATAVVP